MDAWRYEIYLLVSTFDISLVRCAHSFDIDMNTLREAMYYSLFILYYITLHYITLYYIILYYIILYYYITIDNQQ